MTRQIAGFIWEENLQHLRERHPDLDPQDLEDALIQARSWSRAGRDKYEKDVWVIRWGKKTILFNCVQEWVRIFSVQGK